MKIGIEINGVLRDTLLRIEQIYTRWYIDNNFDESTKDKYEVISPVTSLNIRNHLKFENDDALYDFLYKEHTMEIFGHAGSVEYSTMNDLNDFYLQYRDNYDIVIVSDEIGKSKPASLFFLSKFGCLVENYKFYSESTINSLWESIDILLTANPQLLLNHPKNKVVIKFITSYNKDIKIEHEISNFKEFKNKIRELYA